MMFRFPDDGLNLTLYDLIRAGQVKRWHVLPVPSQSLAEHGYNTACFVLSIVQGYAFEDGNTVDRVTGMVHAALFHDVAEVLTGDVPSRVEKPDSLEEVEDAVMKGFGIDFAADPIGAAIIHCADMLDAYRYMMKHRETNYEDRFILERTAQSIGRSLDMAIAELPERLARNVDEIRKAICYGTWRNEFTDIITIWGTPEENNEKLCKSCEKEETCAASISMKPENCKCTGYKEQTE